jgi:predicted NBD/HSP70 family sugar kinase
MNPDLVVPPLSLTERHRRILSTVLTNGPTTRAELARRLHLSRSKLSPEISHLLEHGLLSLDGVNASDVGRPSALLALARAEAAVVVGVDIDADKIAVAASTLGASILSRRIEATDVRNDPEAGVARMIQLIAECLEGPFGPLVAVGVSIAADVDPRSGIPIAAPTMPAWVGYPLGSVLSQRFGTRVYIDNDVNALALREMIVNRSRSATDAALLFVKISHGIGCGIVVNGGLFRGSQGSAGDIGHICVDPADETRCACGNRGCLEAVAAAPALVARAKELAGSNESLALFQMLAKHGDLNEELIGQAAIAGDQVATSLLREQGMRVGYVLSGLVSFFNPSAVLIASGLHAGSDILLSAVRQAVYERALPAATRKLEISEATLSDDSAVVGAAVIASYGYLGSRASQGFHHGLS